MSKSLLTAEQVDNSIVTTKNLNNLGILTKSTITTALVPGTGIKMDPNMLALWHFEGNAIDSVNGIAFDPYFDPEAEPDPMSSILSEGYFDLGLIYNNMTPILTSGVVLDGNKDYSIDYWNLISQYGSNSFYIGATTPTEEKKLHMWLHFDTGEYTSEGSWSLSLIDASTYQEIVTLPFYSEYYPQVGEWYHIAIQKTGFVISIWLDGNNIFLYDLEEVLEENGYTGVKFTDGLEFTSYGNTLDEVRVTQDNPYPKPVKHTEEDPYDPGQSYTYYEVTNFTPETAPYELMSNSTIISATGVKDVNSGTEIKLWTGTAAEYALVDPKDPHTLYIQTTSEE